VQPQKSPLNWKPWAKRIVASIGLLVLGAAGGVWSAGGIEIGPGPRPADAVSTAWDQYETLWRAAQVRTAEKLESGEFKTSQQATAYRSLADGEAIKTTRQPLLDAEFADHGGDKWTAEKQAKFLRGYAR
jgi:hypothetical protein